MCQMAIFIFLHFLKVNSMLFTMVETISKVAELHVFGYGGTTFGTFEKTCFLCESKRVGLKTHVFDHETLKSGLFPCYRLKINDFLSSYNQNLKSTFSHPCSKFLATAKVGLAHYDSFHGGESQMENVHCV